VSEFERLWAVGAVSISLLSTLERYVYRYEERSKQGTTRELIKTFKRSQTEDGQEIYWRTPRAPKHDLRIAATLRTDGHTKQSLGAASSCTNK
jgi:hypothetical protein